MIQIPQNLCTEITDEQASTVQGEKKLWLRRMTAFKAGSDGEGEGFLGKDDDVYAVINGEKINIGSFKTGDIKRLNIVREVGSSATVLFYDKDLLSSDNLVGSMRVSKSIKDGSIVTSGSKSKYEISYSLI